MVWLTGQFQGVIMPTTPIGSIITIEPLAADSWCCHSTLRAAAMASAMLSVPDGACSLADQSAGAPIWREMTSATSASRRL